MRFGRITILAAVIGALWGGIWMTVTGLLLMLITGLVVVPSIGMASLAGLWAGLGVIAISPSSRQRGRLVLASGLLTVLLILLAGGAAVFNCAGRGLHQPNHHAADLGRACGGVTGVMP